MTQPRPRREKKSDRLLSPGATSSEIAVDYAIAPFDRAALDMERLWGVDRLPELVTPALAAKYGAAMAHLNDCINRGDATEAAAAAANCIKGLAAMDAEARSLGHKPAPAEVWLYELDGHRFGIIRETGDWTTLQDSHPGLTLYSLREVALALLSYKSALPKIEAIKAAFPGAEITAVRSKLAEELEDLIPF
jgi:hypothetical protein